MSRTAHLARRLTIAVTTVAAAGIAMLVSAAPAQAAMYAGSGQYGAYGTTNSVTCNSKIFGTSRSAELIAAPPGALARNVNAGAGNDWAWVRYRAFLVNSATGAVVASTPYSGWSYATDEAPATWSGSTVMAAPAGPAYVLDYRIEWWNSTSQIGWVAHRFTTYKLVNLYRAASGSASASVFMY